jgi:hypothetical protein
VIDVERAFEIPFKVVGGKWAVCLDAFWAYFYDGDTKLTKICNGPFVFSVSGDCTYPLAGAPNAMRRWIEEERSRYSRQSQRRQLARRLRSSLWCQLPSWLTGDGSQERTLL